MPAHTRCRICRTALPEPSLDLGPMPLANAFLSSPAEAAHEVSYPLAVTMCPTCTLVQLTYVVPAQHLYRNYIYVSSTSEAVTAHAAWLAQEFPRRYGWTQDHLLVEIASNDGTVLKAFQRAGMRVLGVEPASNIAALAQADGVPTETDFFTAATARTIAARAGRAHGILGRHVFAHVDDLHDFMEGVGALLDDDGVFIIEVPYFGELLARLEFDTIYHEHLSYFFLTPMVRLCEAHGLKLIDVDRVHLHGGSVVVHMRRQGAKATMTPRLQQMLQQEQQMFQTSRNDLERFGGAVCSWRDQFVELMQSLRYSGARLIGYGAAAKGNTLLNYCPSVANSLECILDRNTRKHGRFTPGTHIPVKPVDHWQVSGATHMVLLAWNFKDEIMRQMQPFVQRGGRFVVPIPRPEIV